ncbi:hypothetical protein [Polyangium fumosum]|uniref:Uncharacterized protein n=1 Tax=Polyangium fumosum TaxID=889272 RepID=A0A4U1JHK9_9BACT|nr:hypothetical protein [Polyangium fumosum]TKD09968.1 hypothetical protein E8A74_10180 [Polyangium fumosum]
MWIDKAQTARLSAVHDALGPREKGALRNIEASSSEILGLRNRMKWLIQVGLGATFDGSAMQGGKEIIRVSLHHFDDLTRSTNGTILLGENPKDAVLYRILGEAFVAHCGWRTQLSFDERGGGGSTTAPTFAKLCAEGKIVLAIVDSDRSHAGAPLGQTAENVQKIGHTPLQHVHVLHVRYAENLISPPVYEEAFAGKKSELTALAELKQTERQGGTSAFHDHANLKDALGKKALELAVAWMENKDRKRMAKLLGIEKKGPVGELCEKLVAWGIAPNTRPA